MPSPEQGSKGVGAERDTRGTRTSAVSRTRHPPEQLLCVVLGPDGSVSVDISGRMRGAAPGRAAHVAPEELRDFVTSKAALGRAFRGPVVGVGSDAVDVFVAGVVRGLEARALELLGLARRAGAVTAGMDTTLGLLARCPTAVVILSRDVSPRSRAKVEAALAAVGGRAAYGLSTMVDLGAALGRERVGIVGVDHGKLGRSLVEVLEKLASLERTSESGPERARKND